VSYEVTSTDENIIKDSVITFGCGLNSGPKSSIQRALLGG
jgi:hypothetical protein